MNRNIAFIFPGQGSQYIGMGREHSSDWEAASKMFEEASDLTGIPIKKICFEGPQKELTKTSILQPCLTVVNMICAMAAIEKGLRPAATAGHSLGEFAALWLAKVLSFSDVLKLVGFRGELMDNAGIDAPGAMAAVIGLEKGQLEVEINKLSSNGILSLANHNSREQIVVTGEKELVSALCKVVKEKGARAVPLKVSGAFHSELMRSASDKFSQLIDSVKFNKPEFPVYSNVSAEPEEEPERIKMLLKQQMCSPVRWYDIVNNMHREGIVSFIETGPKKVLSGLVKKSLTEGTEFSVYQAEDPDTLNEILKKLEGV